MRLYFEISGHQIDGARDYQEDAFLNSFLDVSEDSKGSGLVIMADGMGGHAAGNIASNLVVSTFNKTFHAGFGADEVPNVLRMALAKANAALAEAIRETPALDGMGCTMVASLFHEGKVWWVSVGDSHLYLIRDRDLSKRNEDHSYGGYLDRMSAQGMDVEPEPGLSRNMLMSAMTGDDIAEVDCPNEPLQLLPGDRLIVASDGLDTLTSGTIVQMSAWSSSPRECVESLLKAVEDAAKPRQDNTTVVVVDVLDREAGEQAPPRAGTTKKGARAGGASPQSTQPMDLQEIQDAVARKAAEAERPPPFSGREADLNRDDDDQTLSVGRIILILLLVVAMLAGLGAAAWWYLLRTPPATTGEGLSSSVPVGGPDSTSTPVVVPIEAEPEPRSAEPESPVPTLLEPDTTQGTLATPAPPAEFTDPLTAGGVGPVMVVVPPGSFEMGSNLFDRPDEGPKRGVSVDGFAAGKFEVSEAEYARFAAATGRPLLAVSPGAPASDLPVVNVSWDLAVAYTRWLSDQTGHSYRLLSEAEWEYAASTGNGLSYWWGFDFATGKAHCFDCAGGLDSRGPVAVGSFEPNRFGLHDTAGNVLEWVYDCYHANYSGAPADSSVWEGGDCTRRVARGGAYNTPSDSLRSQKRAAFQSTVGRRNIGFRIARDL